MKKIKLEFENASGEKLAGLLELPDQAMSYALFAHCFTCGKDIAAASRISRALAARGIAVLRFDFTGLGSSDGDFANTNFSSNVDDLIRAAEALEENYEAPQILVGHSLGGAAVLSAASRLDSVKAVVTIGAPATAEHVSHLFQDKADQIREQGEALVNLGGREFSIQTQFLNDIESYSSTEQIGTLNAALLVFHSPLDNIVSIDEAARIYQAARHPKSFISLDKADHLLSRAADAEYVASTIASWVARYLDLQAPPTDEPPQLAAGEVLVTEQDKKFLRGLFSVNHSLRADEPLKYGGSDLGPTPYDLLLMSLGACTSMTLRMYANHKKLPLDDVDIWLSHERIHADDCIDGEDCKLERISRRIKLTGDLDEAQRQRLLEIADRCPVHKTLESDPEIVSELV